jgi:transcriptional regulator with XRE-family HTH domain
MDIYELRKNVAQNIFYLRTINHMTQSELGEKLNYSDKAISKWERAEGLPDVFVLKQISELFDVTVDYLVSEHTEQDKKVDNKPARNIKKLILSIVLWGIIAVSVLVMIVLYLAIGKVYWQIFIYALPVNAIVCIVLSCVWWRGRGSFFYTSLLLWSIISSVYVALLQFNIWEIFFIGIPLQIIVFLCYKIKITFTITQKNPKYFVWQDEKSENETKNDK